jgi:hypothetical protein
MIAPDGHAVSMTAFRNLAFGARTPQEAAQLEVMADNSNFSDGNIKD